jgi:hypothetical protein
MGSAFVGLATVCAAILAAIQVWPILHPKQYPTFRGSLSLSNPQRTDPLGPFLVDHYNDIVQLQDGWWLSISNQFNEGVAPRFESYTVPLRPRGA